MRRRGFHPVELWSRLARECGVGPNLEGRSLTEKLHREWARLSALLAERVCNDRSFTQYLPAAFRAAINDLRGLT